MFKIRRKVVRQLWFVTTHCQLQEFPRLHFLLHNCFSVLRCPTLHAWAGERWFTIFRWVSAQERGFRKNLSELPCGGHAIRGAARTSPPPAPKAPPAVLVWSSWPTSTTNWSANLHDSSLAERKIEYPIRCLSGRRGFLGLPRRDPW